MELDFACSRASSQTLYPTDDQSQHWTTRELGSFEYGSAREIIGHGTCGEQNDPVAKKYLYTKFAALLLLGDRITLLTTSMSGIRCGPSETILNGKLTVQA